MKDSGIWSGSISVRNWKEKKPRCRYHAVNQWDMPQPKKRHYQFPGVVVRRAYQDNCGYPWPMAGERKKVA